MNPSAHWLISNWDAPTRCRATLPRAAPRIKFSSHSGKTPILTSPSCAKPRPNTRTEVTGARGRNEPLTRHSRLVLQSDVVVAGDPRFGGVALRGVGPPEKPILSFETPVHDAVPHNSYRATNSDTDGGGACCRLRDGECSLFDL